MSIKNKIIFLKLASTSIVLYALYVLVFITYKFINFGLYFGPAMVLLFIIFFGYKLFKYSNEIVIWSEST